MHSRYSRFKQAISRTALIAIVVVVIVVIALGAYEAVLVTTNHNTSSTTSSSSASTTSSTTSTGITNTAVPSTFTYYTAGAINYLDPQVSYYSYDYNIIQNVYEPLLWFNGANGTQLIPWLASNYTTSSDGRTWTINLRHVITFQDG